MYKLRRLWNLQITDEIFAIRDIPEEKKRFGSHITDDYVITAVYDASVKYRLVEVYGHTSFKEQEDGKLYTEWGFTDPNEAVLWFLGFGDKVEIIHPPEMIEKIKNMINNLSKKYEGK